MSPEVYESFAEELTKIAAFSGNLAELGRRVINPRSGLAQGWRALGPVANEKSIARQGRGILSRTWRGLVGQGTHIAEAPGSGQGFVGAMEDASRQGWTGTGRISKYIPIGGKSQMVIGTASGIPSIVAAARGEREAGVGESLGENLGYGIAGVISAGTGAAGIPFTIGAARLSKALGRRADEAMKRIRG